MSLRNQSKVGCFSELCFLQYSVAQMLVGLQNQFENHFCFYTWDCSTCINNNNDDNSRFIIIRLNFVL